MARSSGAVPYRTYQIRPGALMPYCNDCDKKMGDIKLSILHLRVPSKPYMERFPWGETAAICPECKLSSGIEDEFLLVPWPRDLHARQQLLDRLKPILDTLADL